MSIAKLFLDHGLNPPEVAVIGAICSAFGAIVFATMGVDSKKSANTASIKEVNEFLDIMIKQAV